MGNISEFHRVQEIEKSIENIDIYEIKVTLCKT